MASLCEIWKGSSNGTGGLEKEVAAQIKCTKPALWWEVNWRSWLVKESEKCWPGNHRCTVNWENWRWREKVEKSRIEEIGQKRRSLVVSGNALLCRLLIMREMLAERRGERETEKFRPENYSSEGEWGKKQLVEERKKGFRSLRHVKVKVARKKQSVAKRKRGKWLVEN